MQGLVWCCVPCILLHWQWLLVTFEGVLGVLPSLCIMLPQCLCKLTFAVCNTKQTARLA